MTKFRLFGRQTDEVSERELSHRQLAREVAAEGMVLLKNEGVLPLQNKKIALFGAGARMTVKGGTGWGAEFAKICNKPLLVFDQEQDGWYRWLNDAWVKVEEPVIEHTHFTATGTRFMEANGRKAISDLFARSFNR